MADYVSMDEVDLRILQCLLDDSTLSNKEIGQRVHLTGQAVGARIRKLRDLGVIEGYTLRWNPAKAGLAFHAFVTVFMKSGAAHQDFLAYVRSNEQIAEVHRVTSEGCYWMRVIVGTQEDLNAFLDRLLQYGNYKVSLSIGRLK